MSDYNMIRYSGNGPLRVAEFLVAQGVAADRLTSLGLGEGNPRTEDPFDPLNRRVEMKLNIQ